jgi:hypothetical protein
LTPLRTAPEPAPLDRLSERPALTVEVMEPTSRRNLRGRGTVTRYRSVTSDGIEREVLHGQLESQTKSPTRSADLTIGTAPPLSVGPDGMMMHFLLRTLEQGVEVVLFGPELGRSDRRLGAEGRTRIAGQLSLPRSAVAAHAIADRLQHDTGSDLSTMLWTGISLGAIKGIVFSALAPDWGRTMAYSHFVVPVCPVPRDPPTDAELRRYLFGELRAMARASAELAWKDLRDRSLGIYTDAMRLTRPGLLARYVLSAPPDAEFRTFTAAWRSAIVNGDAGVAAAGLPLDRPVTFELYDRDNGNPSYAWARLLEEQLTRGRARLLMRHGLHSDAARLSEQQRRAVVIRSVINAVNRGTPVDELVHPLDERPRSRSGAALRR